MSDKSLFGDALDERGFPSWEYFEPEPSYLDRVTDINTYAGALGPYLRGIMQAAESPVGQHILGNLGDVMDDVEIPARAVHGLARGGYGLATGESPGQAFTAGMNTFGNTIDENAEALRAHAAAGGATPWDQGVLYWGTLLADPTNLLGFNFAKNAGRAAVKEAVESQK